MVKDYILQNWALILILLAFGVSLISTVFLDKKTIVRYFVLIDAIFLLSILVFIEFYYTSEGSHRDLRIVLMSLRYSAAPLIIALVMYTLIKKMHWLVFIPAAILFVIDIISIFTGIVFTLDESGTLKRGILGLLPFIVAGLYCIGLIVILFKRSNKQVLEIIPIIFLSFTLASGVFLPFVFGNQYANIFCTTMAIALFAYYEFSILLLTKKDSLTGLLNRQAYYADINNERQSINAVVSIDMNGLKVINDTYGHNAGDEALTVLSICFMRALKRNQFIYRIGGDEFIILCRKNEEQDVLDLIDKIRKNVSDTKYTCSIGYSYSQDGTKTLDDMFKESDEMMYVEKKLYYLASGKERRKQ